MSALPDHRLRAHVHAVLDPLWENAPETGGYKPKRQASRSEGGKRHVRKVARERVYAWLAEKMWLSEGECHVTRFTADQCHEAIRLLSATTYAEIRAWAHGRQIVTEAQVRARAAARALTVLP